MVIKGFLMKKYFLIGILAAFMALPSYAKIIETTASGSGSSEYAATMDAIDNAVRQTHKVDVKNDKGVDLSETHIIVKDDTQIKAKAQAKTKTSAWSKIKGWFGGGSSESESYDSAAEASYSYEKKGGNQEFHDTSVSREIEMKYQGAIESYEVLKSKESHGKWTVTIKAKVKQLDEYVSPDLINKAKYRVAIVSSGNTTQWNCLGSKKSSKYIEDIAIKEMTDKIVNSKKMSVVDRNNIDKQLKELSLLNKDLANPDNANKLKQIAIADYLLIVTTDSFNASTTTKTLELTGEKVTKGSAGIEISYKLIETATMDIVASGSDSTDMSLGAGANCSSVVSSMTKKLSKSLSEDLLNQLDK